ncbi:2-dehydropantoate 2-reductase [Actinospongicola halichondriae]|uniref:2-dehydropantoate 2-reductase n=1 Tax=Actinospongicola halichondriae TaxID=3236844 RepID=UPI003D527386
MTSYTVIGAGAVGLLYGARLAEAGHRVRWVVRTGLDDIRRDGIQVRSPDGDIDLAPADVESYGEPRDVPPSDVVIVALKTTANDRLESLVAPAVADGATIAMFQNGLGVEERMQRAAPNAGSIIGAMCFVCAHRRRPGVVDHLDYGAVTVGQLGVDSMAAMAMVHDLEGAGGEATVVDDLGVARWRKLVWNIPFNGLSVVLDAPTDALLSTAASRRLVSDLMDEVIAGARSAGHDVPAVFRDEMLATTDAMTPYAPSMKLDHDAGRSMELEAIYDAPLAAAADGSMPRVAALRDQLRFVEARSRVSSGGHG